MNRFFSIIIYAATFCCAIFQSQVQAHGFGESTLIKTSKVGWWSIGQVYRIPSSEKQRVLSYDIRTSKCIAATVKAAAESETNCYFKIGLDNNPDIICTPIQEFYMPETKGWVPAYKLQVGDKLLSNCTTAKAITSIEFVKKPLKIYALRIKGHHNFMVGRHNILTHNLTLAIPSLVLSIFTTFGEGAVAGGTAGSLLGPVGCTLTAVVGGLVLTGGWLIWGNDRKRTTFDANFDAGSFGDYFNAKGKSGEEDKAKDDTKAGDERETGAQAPGKPREEDGFIPPKNWDGEKVKNPNGSGAGWPDEKGHVWVPTGPGSKAHGGPHWDVQDPKTGKHRNILPGGRER